MKFLHMWKNFQFPHNCHTWKAEISPHDNFFSTNISWYLWQLSGLYKRCWFLLSKLTKLLQVNEDLAFPHYLHQVDHTMVNTHYTGYDRVITIIMTLLFLDHY